MLVLAKQVVKPNDTHKRAHAHRYRTHIFKERFGLVARDIGNPGSCNYYFSLGKKIQPSANKGEEDASISTYAQRCRHGTNGMECLTNFAKDEYLQIDGNIHKL